MAEDEEPETVEEVEETQEEQAEDEVVEGADYTGYKCVKCEQEVEIDPVEEKIICPKCSHRVLLKMRSNTPKKVEAV